MRRVVVLRPEPGNAATVTRIRAAGLEPLALPLFDISPLDWVVPDAAGFDGLLVTSANALRHGGAQLDRLHALPVVAVGAATAEAARAAGFTVAESGTGNAAALLNRTARFSKLLWLAGQDRTRIDHPVIACIRTVYAARRREIAASALHTLDFSVVLLHSARATSALVDLLQTHHRPASAIRVAAISAAVADAVGPGWDRVAIAGVPTDDALIATTRALAIDP